MHACPQIIGQMDKLEFTEFVLFLLAAACSIGCPAGQYEASRCGTEGDRSCTGCQECTGSMYEVRPCGGTANRHCMHAAHPLLITGEQTTPAFLEATLAGLKVEASDNVFLENLHSTRNLETTYYVTDMTQASDFYWIRESGLQVNIGILDVNLIPEFEDIQHDSDNAFMANIPGDSEDTVKFRSILRDHCRHPIPDHYSLTLEISRDRITAAHPYTCDSKNPDVEDCPSSYNDGDLFLHRTLNEACKKMGTFPEPLEPAENSYVCTQNTGLLSEIFNQTYTEEIPIYFPGPECKRSSSRCEQCLSQSKCHMGGDVFMNRCCQINCYILPDCKIATSDRCARAPIECAMGDAYRYTIQPMFENIKNEFQCHIRRRKLKILYRLFYYIMLPERKFQTPHIYKTIYAHDIEYQSRGSFTADYFTVEHNTGLNLKDDFVIVGQDLPGMDRLNHTIYSLKEEKDFRKKKFNIHRMSHNVHVVPVQVSKPFAYSTLNWVRNNFCEKDIGNFKSVQKMHNSDGQNVNVRLERQLGSPFKYFLKSKENPPYIRFLAPGNTSVLPYYFRDNGPVLYTNKSLVATLELTARGRIWVIHLAGKMSGCPGYLGITINNRLDLEELFRYDTLIFCPAEFNLTFKVPNWGQEPDKTFDIRLEDSKQSYDIYLTHMLFEQDEVELEAEVAPPTEPSQNNWVVLSTIIALGGICILVFLISFVFLECTKSQLIYSSHKINVYHATNGKQNDNFCISARNLTRGQVIFIVLYTILRLLYSLVFTFTIFFAVLMLFIRTDFDVLSRFGEYQREKTNATHGLMQKISQYGQDELLRQAKLVTNMQGACSFYIEELFHRMQTQMDNITANQHQQSMYSDHSSISYFLNEHVSDKLGIYWGDIDNYTDRYRSSFDTRLGPKFTRYNKYLKKLYDNDWFEFAQLLYNHSFERYNEQMRGIVTGNLSGKEVDFATFLEVEEVEGVQMWPTQYWQRYGIQLPPVPLLPIPSVDNVQKPRCDLPLKDETNNITTQTPSTELDSSRFFATHLPGRSIRGPSYKSEHVEHEYRFLTETEAIVTHEIQFSVIEFIESIDTHILKIIFMVLDILIVIYRCSRTYVTATTLCRGFEESVTYRATKTVNLHANMKESELQNLQNQAKHMVPDERTGDQGYYREDKDHIDASMTDYSTTLDSQKSMLPSKPTANSMQGMVRNDIHGGQSYHQQVAPAEWQEETALQSCGGVILRMLQNTIIPKLLIAFVLLLLFHSCVTVVCLVFSLDTLSDLDGFQSLLAGLDVQVNQTNWYLKQQAHHFNTITMKIYEQQMRSELLHLQSMLEYFNAEQTRIVKNYIAEACAVKRGLLGNRPCDIDVNPMKLIIPMLPCNFVPIQPQLYTDFKQHVYRSQLGADFIPFLVSARNVALKTGYAILSVVLIMIIIHVAGAVLFHYLKTRHKFTVHRIYILNSPPMPQLTLPLKEGESDSDENESGFKTYAARVQVSPGKSNPKTDALMADFKYSETKV